MNQEKWWEQVALHVTRAAKTRLVLAFGRLALWAAVSFEVGVLVAEISRNPVSMSDLALSYAIMASIFWVVLALSAVGRRFLTRPFRWRDLLFPIGAWGIAYAVIGIAHVLPTVWAFVLSIVAGVGDLLGSLTLLEWIVIIATIAIWSVLRDIRSTLQAIAGAVDDSNGKRMEW